jgi:uncharacterized membrane protein YphA (DoxX/SURF4 family)
MKKLIDKMYNPPNAKLGQLVLRVTLGSIFLIHGIQKLSNMEGTIGFFGMLGFSAFWAWVVALVEAIGGAAVIFGIGTRIAASLLAIIMLVVIVHVKKGDFKKEELDIVLLGLSLGVGLIGCGSWSLCRTCHKGNCKTCEVSGTCACDCKSAK